jgi:hypothetical protein
VTEEEDVVAEVMKITGAQGASVVFDPLAFEAPHDALQPAWLRLALSWMHGL